MPDPDATQLITPILCLLEDSVTCDELMPSLWPSLALVSACNLTAYLYLRTAGVMFKTLMLIMNVL